MAVAAVVRPDEGVASWHSRQWIGVSRLSYLIIYTETLG